MRVSENLKLEAISLNITPGTKDQLLSQLVDLLPLPEECDRATVLEEIQKRESISSTGIGEGVAIPHAKIDIQDDLIFSFGVCQDPQPFASHDQKPVQIFIMVVSRKDATGPHIRALAQLARAMQSEEFRGKIISAKEPQKIIDFFKEEEDRNL